MIFDARSVCSALVVIAAAVAGSPMQARGQTTATIDVAAMRVELATIFQTSSPQVKLSNQRVEMAQRLGPLMVRQAGHLAGLLQEAPGLDGALSITASASNEHSIRPNARALNGLAAMYRTLPDSALPTTLTREMCRDKAVAMLRFVLPTHGAGNGVCADGKKWKGQWQSALWANSAGMGAWLLRDELDPELQWLAARMVADEADRFVGKTPPSQVEDDTKAEENAWNSTVISLAACMFPQHPHRKAWLETARVWAVSSFVRNADLKSSRTIDGKTLAERGLGPTLHDDYTMENHHRVHPDYMNTINLTLEQWLPYSWAGIEPPEALRFNTREVYGTLRALTFPDAGYIYVNGQDWQLHRNPQWLPTYALQAIVSKDREAAFLAQRALEVNEAMMARTADGGVFLPEEFSFPSAQADTLEMYMEVYLAACAFGEGAEPVSEQEHWEALEGVHLYETGKFAVVRTKNSVATFSWGDQPMGMILPLQKDLLISPNERNLIGTISADGIVKEQPKMVYARPRIIDGNFVVSGLMERAGGAVHQRFAFAALKDGRVVYVDDLVIKKPLVNPQINLGALAVLNDKRWIFHDGKRDLYWPAGGNRGDKGAVTFDVNDEATTKPWMLDSPWYNLDDALGIVIPASGGVQRYDANTTTVNGRLEQMFHLTSLTHHTKPLEPSEKPYTWQTLVFYPGQTRAETAAMGDKVKCKWPESGICLIVMEDGLRFQIDLDHSNSDSGVHISYPPNWQPKVSNGKIDGGSMVAPR